MTRTKTVSLHEMLAESASVHGARRALVEASTGADITYASLDRLSDRVAARLRALGVARGDRVGIYLRKSIDGIASMFGILKTGAAYVPVDPTAPSTRNAFIHNNCAVKAVIVESRFQAAYEEELRKLGPVPPLVILDGVGGGRPLEGALDRLDADTLGLEAPAVRVEPEDLAYILYTSGSTGLPKGVMISHDNALSFIDWCSSVFEPDPNDVFSSHAPFHFDLSILDIYVPLKHGATMAIIGEEASKDPMALSGIISQQRITIWYSAPSILSLLAQFGRIAEHDFSSLRMVLFAGEVFPIGHLRSFKTQVPLPRYFNLYGPTETNVCTYFEIPRVIPDDRSDPYPIGAVCSNLEGRVVDMDGRDVASGTEGELCIAGPNVLLGYWGLPDRTAGAFLPPAADGKRWYKTGDLVVETADGIFKYVGRRDRMIKKRGYRVELGEIEACLYRHQAIREAAVVAIQDEATGVRVKAHLSTVNGRPSVIDLKAFCSKTLPLYMIPDQFAFHETLPKTSTDKIDYVALTRLG